MKTDKNRNIILVGYMGCGKSTVGRKAARALEYQFLDTDSVIEEEVASSDEPSITIDELELSVRAYNCLKRASINSMAELLKKSEHDLLNIKNFGKKSSDEVIERLRHFGLDLAPSPELDEEGMVIESAE